MDIIKYQNEAAFTMKAGQFFGDNVTVAAFMAATYNFVKAAEELDAIKKALFYNKGKVGPTNSYGMELCSAIPLRIDARNVEAVADIIHMIVGLATESGELMEELRKAIQLSRRFDNVNLKEEGGDQMWYLANLFTRLGETFESVGEINNAKLRARFPDGFSEHDAVNRDLTNERRVLEGKQGLSLDIASNGQVVAASIDGREAFKVASADIVSGSLSVGNPPVGIVGDFEK